MRPRINTKETKVSMLLGYITKDGQDYIKREKRPNKKQKPKRFSMEELQEYYKAYQSKLSGNETSCI